MTHSCSSNKTHGGAAELLVAHELMEHGFGVCIPLGDSEPYDLISTYRQTLNRIQVKSSRAKTKGGTYRILFRRGRLIKRPYSKDEADFIVAVLYYETGPAIYIIPVEAIDTSKGVFFDIGKHPRYPSKWPSCKWEKYRGRWDQLNAAS